MKNRTRGQPVWAALERGEAQLFLRTELERRYGAPPGAHPVSLDRHVRTLSARARSIAADTRFARKRPGAAEVAGGFVTSKEARLAIGKID
jgi:hypothetical protein